jgi:hypothetical protein
MQPIRALTLLDAVPAGCILHLVADDDSAPHLRAGEFAIVDTTDTEPQHGEVYLVRWSHGGPSLRQLLARSHTCDGQSYVGFWTRCLNFEPYREDRTQAGRIRLISHRSMADGPRLADVIQKSLIGRVVGIYSASSNRGD